MAGKKVERGEPKKIEFTVKNLSDVYNLNTHLTVMISNNVDLPVSVNEGAAGFVMKKGTYRFVYDTFRRKVKLSINREDNNELFKYHNHAHRFHIYYNLEDVTMNEKIMSIIPRKVSFKTFSLEDDKDFTIPEEHRCCVKETTESAHWNNTHPDPSPKGNITAEYVPSRDQKNLLPIPSQFPTSISVKPYVGACIITDPDFLKQEYFGDMFFADNMHEKAKEVIDNLNHVVWDFPDYAWRFSGFIRVTDDTYNDIGQMYAIKDGYFHINLKKEYFCTAGLQSKRLAVLYSKSEEGYYIPEKLMLIDEDQLPKRPVKEEEQLKETEEESIDENMILTIPFSGTVYSSNEIKNMQYEYIFNKRYWYYYHGSKFESEDGTNILCVNPCWIDNKCEALCHQYLYDAGSIEAEPIGVMRECDGEAGTFTIEFFDVETKRECEKWLEDGILYISPCCKDENFNYGTKLSPVWQCTRFSEFLILDDKNNCDSKGKLGIVESVELKKVARRDDIPALLAGINALSFKNPCFDIYGNKATVHYKGDATIPAQDIEFDILVDESREILKTPPEKGYKMDNTTKRSNYLSWDRYFMGIALLSSFRSKDPSTQVGACIVKDRKIMSVGYNGFPKGCKDDKFPWSKVNQNPEDNKYAYVVHAELNAILNFPGITLKGSTLYTTLFPCNECAKAIIQAGIKKVVYYDAGNDNGNLLKVATERMFKAAGVKTQAFTEGMIEIKY